MALLQAIPMLFPLITQKAASLVSSTKPDQTDAAINSSSLTIANDII
jgi:hypothetical protein